MFEDPKQSGIGRYIWFGLLSAMQPVRGFMHTVSLNHPGNSIIPALQMGKLRPGKAE